MAQDAETRERMESKFRDAMLKSATKQAEARIDAELAHRRTWYEGDITIEFINLTVEETYGTYASYE